MTLDAHTAAEHDHNATPDRAPELDRPRPRRPVHHDPAVALGAIPVPLVGPRAELAGLAQDRASLGQLAKLAYFDGYSCLVPALGPTSYPSRSR